MPTGNTSGLNCPTPFSIPIKFYLAVKNPNSLVKIPPQVASLHQGIKADFVLVVATANCQESRKMKLIILLASIAASVFGAPHKTVIYPGVGHVYGGHGHGYVYGSNHVHAGHHGYHVVSNPVVKPGHVFTGYTNLPHSHLNQPIYNYARKVVKTTGY